MKLVKKNVDTAESDHVVLSVVVFKICNGVVLFFFGIHDAIRISCQQAQFLTLFFEKGVCLQHPTARAACFRLYKAVNWYNSGLYPIG